MHTTKEAKQLCCPMVRHPYNRGARNQDPLNKNPPTFTGANEGDAYGCHCISHQCALWRWENDHRTLPITVGKEAHAAQIAAQRGYCGLAPQQVVQT